MNLHSWYVHLSPPCGTAARATEAALRDDLHPHGLPSLKGADKVRVNQANRLFEFCARACKIMYMRGILFSIEGPLQSFLWATTWWREFLADVPIFVTTLHQCMFGHPRKKASRQRSAASALKVIEKTLLENLSCVSKFSSATSSFGKLLLALAFATCGDCLCRHSPMLKAEVICHMHTYIQLCALS